MAAPAHIARENGKKGGRPKGSTNRPTIFEYWDKGDIAEFFRHLKETYKKDSRLLVWVGDHLLGKAPQALTGPNGEPLTIHFDASFDASTPETARGRKK